MEALAQILAIAIDQREDQEEKGERLGEEKGKRVTVAVQHNA